MCAPGSTNLPCFVSIACRTCELCEGGGPVAVPFHPLDPPIFKCGMCRFRRRRLAPLFWEVPLRSLSSVAMQLDRAPWCPDATHATPKCSNLPEPAVFMMAGPSGQSGPPTPEVVWGPPEAGGGRRLLNTHKELFQTDATGAVQVPRPDRGRGWSRGLGGRGGACVRSDPTGSAG